MPLASTPPTEEACSPTSVVAISYPDRLPIGPAALGTMACIQAQSDPTRRRRLSRKVSLLATEGKAGGLVVRSRSPTQPAAGTEHQEPTRSDTSPEPVTRLPPISCLERKGSASLLKRSQGETRRSRRTIICAELD
jgi:hypothetical protein